jgi:hypothetical protein
LHQGGRDDHLPPPQLNLQAQGRSDIAGMPLQALVQTHQVVPHIEIVSPLEEQLGFRHIAIASEEYAVTKDGKNVFGVMTLDQGIDGAQFALGVRNSHSKQFRSIVAGAPHFRMFEPYDSFTVCKMCESIKLVHQDCGGTLVKKGKWRTCDKCGVKAQHVRLTNPKRNTVRSVHLETVNVKYRYINPYSWGGAILPAERD